MKCTMRRKGCRDGLTAWWGDELAAGGEEADIVQTKKHRAIHVYVSHSRRAERNVRIRYTELLGKSGSATDAKLIIQCTQHPPTLCQRILSL